MGEAGFQFLFLALFIIPAIFFLVTQQNTLKAIQPQNRAMAPGLVWLQLIPLFGLIWQFFVVIKISDSLKKELVVRSSLFSFEKNMDNSFAANLPRPTYRIGLAYCLLMCGTLIPVLKGLFALAGLVCWVIYWIQLANCKKSILQWTANTIFK